jgi:hypothetical protein
MAKFKKVLLRCLLIFIILILVAAFAHFIIFPQETRTILIGFSNFKKEGHLYYNASTPTEKIDTLKSLIAAASTRVADFWGAQKANPKFIYCDTDDDFKKYGNDRKDPATTQYKMGPYVIISNEGLDLDIIAHEISHAELYARTGFYEVMFKIPRWFDEGLAMQNDYRNYYSEDTLKVRSDNFRNLPDITKFNSGGAFYEGPPAQVKLNYLTAKHIVKNWYTKEKLAELIAGLTSGKGFAEVFK